VGLEPWRVAFLKLYRELGASVEGFLGARKDISPYPLRGGFKKKSPELLKRCTEKQREGCLVIFMEGSQSTFAPLRGL
jgi:hypothetical protein